MKGVNVIIKKGLKKELKDLSKQVVIGAANASRDMLTDAAYEAFERFYCDYAPAPYGLGTSYKWKFYTPSGTPWDYDRTYNILRNGIHKFEEKGTVRRGGVEINPDWLEDNYEDASADFVFSTIYESGWHGPRDIPPMVPTPEQIIMQKYDYIRNSVIDFVVYNEASYFVRECTYLHSHGITRNVRRLKGIKWNK